MAGILCPVMHRKIDINSVRSKCSNCSFQSVRTSQIEFALFERILVGEGIVY